LLELLLVVSVLSLLAALASGIFDQWFKDSIDRKVGRETQQLQNAAESYVELNINLVRGTLVPVVGDVAEIFITDLQDAGFLPSGYDGVNSYRQQMRTFVRYASDATSRGDVFEVIVVSDNIGGSDSRMEDKRLFRAAKSGQRSVGLISNLDISATCCNGTIQSANGEWSVPLSVLASAGYTTTPNADGGYMAAYGRIFTDELLVSNYLYRFDVPEITDANRMMTNLDITNNDIQNAGVIVADSVSSIGDTNVDGNAFSRLGSNYSFNSSAGLNASNLNVSSDVGENNGNIRVIGDDGTGVDFVVRGNMLKSGTSPNPFNVSANSLLAQEVRVDQEGRFATVNNTGNTASAQNVYSQQGTYSGDGQIQIVNDLQVSNVNGIADVNSATSATGQLNVTTNPFSVGQNVQVDKNAVIGGGLNVGGGEIRGSAEVSIRTLDRPCGTDCP
jgi:type II secretory pathway pseudopilin PulG